MTIKIVDIIESSVCVSVTDANKINQIIAQSIMIGDKITISFESITVRIPVFLQAMIGDYMTVFQKKRLTIY